MRKACLPSAAKGGTCSKRAISSSRPIRLAIVGFRSRHQLIAASLCYKDSWSGGVSLDLLAEAVDVRFKRMSSDAGIIAPYFLQQGFARNRFLPGAIKIAQNGRFLFSQEHLRAWPERVGTNREDGILARLVLSKLRTDARQKHSKTKWLRNVVIGARFKAEDGIGIRIVTCQHNDRGLETIFAKNPHGLPTVDVGQAHIHNNQIDLAVLGRVHTFGSAIRRNCIEFLV